MKKTYLIQGGGARKETLSILKEKKGGFDVLITRYRDDWKQEKKEYLPRELFETCIRTRYLQETGA